jgi:hypothetical protein
MDKKNDINIEMDLAKNSHSRDEMYFIKYFNVFPKHSYRIFDIPKISMGEVREFIEKKYDDLDLIYSIEWLANNEEEDIKYYDGQDEDALLVSIKNSVIIKFSSDLEIFSKYEIENDFLNEMKSIIKRGRDENNKNSVHVLSFTQDRGMYLTDFKVSDEYKELDLESNYNDDFIDIHNKILDSLSSESVGLYLLHGDFGTGKTTYIRHLIRNTDKRVIFVSPSMVDQFSSPEMIPFLMKYPNSIIIIEDAENIIKTREAGGNQSVSNLLNLSDGVLGDCLKFQIICTFNTNKRSIDKALLRKGRLIQSYEFNELTIEKTNMLQEKLGFEKTKEPLRLSDIYGQESNNFEQNGKKLGYNYPRPTL